MAEIINLNRFRKSKQKQASTKKAEENRVKYGRTKEDRKKAATEEATIKSKHQAKKLTKTPPTETTTTNLPEE